MERISLQIHGEYLNAKWNYKLDNLRLFHFCSYETAFRILDNKKFWATDIISMNDSRDGFVFFDYFVKCLSSKISALGGNLAAHVNRVNDPDFAINSYVSGFGNNIQEAMFCLLAKCVEISEWRNNSGYAWKGIYLTSFCSNPDSDNLFNWLAYGDGGGGIGLGFNAMEFHNSVIMTPRTLPACEGQIFDSSLDPDIFKVIYMSKEKIEKKCQNIINEVFQSLSSVDFNDFDFMRFGSVLTGLARNILFYSQIIKLDKFEDEHEFRLLFSVEEGNRDSRLSNVFLGSCIYPVLEYDWGISALDTIYFGAALSSRQKSGFSRFIECIYLDTKLNRPRIVNSEINLQKRR